MTAPRTFGWLGELLTPGGSSDGSSNSDKLETVLVVDDNEFVLGSVVAVLESAGFRVLSALSGVDAITLAKETDLEIHLLVSDVDMPRMSGPVLGAALKKSRPDLRVILMSGADNGLLILNYGWTYLQKPFLATRLVEMVSSVLRSENRSQGAFEFDRRKDKDPS
jgi:DNA-binding NtrC family response regulator